MVKRLEKRNFTTEQARDLCYRRASDKSDDDVSDEDSDQSFDSGAEAMFQEGRDITLDKEVLPAGEDHEAEEGEVGREGEAAAAEVKPVCQPSHLERDAMMLMMQM
ncbi:unnamed protein product [Pleuronectes platessa]|uniref:Uncharacterized protein n=1 Tax=Pleuronectes platessa TaxID=8262 RepID=A0A9N7TXK3_PLEPL|nr:unnamed protein product [Pleuronectes platessa]